jgi:hypothetical protein
MTMTMTMLLLWKQRSSLFLWVAAASCCLFSSGVHGRQLDQDAPQDLDPQPERIRTDLVRLIPFDVQIAMTGPPSNVNIYALTDIVTDWLTDSFLSKSGNGALISNNSTTFDSLGLELRTRRKLQDQQQQTAGNPIQLYTANYDGVTLWERRGLTTPPMEAEIVEFIQRATFLEDNTLLTLLRAAEAYTGLGETVVDVRAYVAPPSTASDDGNSDNLQIIIIIAIVVACLAFGLLSFAVIWAWRTDQTKRDAYIAKGDRSVPRMDVPTGSEETDYNEHSPTGMTPPAVADLPSSSPAVVRPPHEIGSSLNQNKNNDYPDSVISEDISTSLTAYYRSGMAGYSNTGGTRGSNSGPRELNDAASMSSMDSYGYSLDGYAPSLGPAPQGYPVGPFNGMIHPDTDYSEDEEGNSYTKEDSDDQ